MVRAQLVVAFFITGGWLAAPAPAHACSCGGPTTSSMNARASDIVFVGTVLGVDRPRPWVRLNPDGSASAGSATGPTSVTFEVLRVFRGRSEPRFVMTTFEGSSCDHQFDVSQTWLVYASERDGAITTNKCTRTRLREEAVQDLAYLEGAERQRPLGILFGVVLRRGSDAGGRPALRALEEPLDVVAVGDDGRRFVANTDAGGPFQIVLPPGDFEISVERQGQPVSSRQRVRVDVDTEQRLTLTASY